jgi:uncharacterized membrane protein
MEETDPKPAGARGPFRTRATHHRDEAEVEFSRIVAFSDGVFAIAITLLVLALEIPAAATDVGEELWDQRDSLFAYAISFAVVGRFWISHHRFYSSLARFDNTLMGLNLFYLAWVVLVPFSSEVLGDYNENTDATIVYAANMAAASFTFVFQINYAFRHGLMRESERALAPRYAGPANFIIAAIFVVSIPVALLSTYAAQAMWLVSILVGRRISDWVAARQGVTPD